MQWIPAELRSAARAVGWHRRLLAAGLAAGAVALALHAAEPTPPPTVPVVVAAGELPGGAALVANDLRITDLPADAAPTGVLTSVDAAVGQVLAGPVRAGEPLTNARLVGPGLLAGWSPDLVATPVRVADPGVVALVRPGDRVDLYAAPVSGVEPATVIAAAVPVIAVPEAGDPAVLAEGALLVVGVTDRQAGALAEAAVISRLSVTIRAPVSASS